MTAREVPGVLGETLDSGSKATETKPLCGDRRAAFAAAIDDYCVSYCILQSPVAQKPISAIATFNLKVNQAVYFPTRRCCLTLIIEKALHWKK